MLCIGATEFIISCVKTRVSRLHDSTSLRASSRFISLPISFSVFCRSRSPGNSRVVGRQKVKALKLDSVISFAKEDCMALSFEDNTFDAVTAAFGIRNFQNLDQGLREMCRVLKPGGHLCIVELTSPVMFPMKQLFKVYSHTVLPIYGRLISGDRVAYSYLTATIEAFPQGERMVEILKAAGFAKATFKRLTLGICTLYLATK